jgi:hypothetical protein
LDFLIYVSLAPDPQPERLGDIFFLFDLYGMNDSNWSLHLWYHRSPGDHGMQTRPWRQG